MADIQTSTWSETAGSNNAATPNGYPEGMAYSDMNNCARETMGAIKREWNRSHSTINTAGTSTALTLTYTTAPAAYVQGMRFQFRLNQDIGAAATLNVNALGAKTIQRMGPAGYVNLAANEYRSGQLVEVVYDANLGVMCICGAAAKIGLQHIQTQNFAASASLAFILPVTGFSNYRLLIQGVTRSAGNSTSLGIQGSTDGGSNYVASYSCEGVIGSTPNATAPLSVVSPTAAVALVFQDFNSSNTVSAVVDIVNYTDMRFLSVASGAKYNVGAPYFAVETIASIASGTMNALRILWDDGGSFSASGRATLFGYNEG